MSRSKAARRWLRSIVSLTLFTSLFAIAFAASSAAQTCDNSCPANLEIAAPTPNTSPPGYLSTAVYRDPSGVGTEDYIYVTMTDVGGYLDATDLTPDAQFPNDFQVTFPSDTPLVADGLGNPINSAGYELAGFVTPGAFPDEITLCQYNPAGLFGGTNSVTCNVPDMYNGWTITVAFYVQLPVNQNSVGFTAAVDVNNDMPGINGGPVSWTTQITHPDLTAQFLDPNNPPATVYIGTGFNYNVTFQNVGPAATPGPVSADIQLPVAGLSSAAVTSTTDGTCTYNHPTLFDESRSVTCTFDPMQPGSQILVSIGATASTNTGYYTATATIDPNDVTGDESSTNTASITTYVTDLSAPPAVYTPVTGAPIPVGYIAQQGQGVAIDPVTGMVFAVNPLAGSVEAISEATQSVVTGIDAGGPGYAPSAVATDPVSGTVYVAEVGPPSQVLVISEDPSDPADDQVTGTVTVPPGTEGFNGPEGIAVLPGTAPDTGTVYVTNGASDTVSVISEATNTVTDVIPIPDEGGENAYPWGVTVDPATGLVYVADQGDGYVSVISGSTLLGSIGVGAGTTDPTAIAADPDTGTVYVTVPSPSQAGAAPKVDVIQEDPASPASASVVAAIPVPAFGDFGSPYGVPEAIAVDPATATVLVSNYEGALDVINEDTADPAADAFNTGETVALDPSDQDFDAVYAMAVDTSAGNSYSGTAYVVSDATDEMYPVSFPPGQEPQSISFTAPATGTVGQSATLTATGGGSGYPVTFTVDASSSAGACTVSGDTVSYLAPGSCVIDANQAGNLSYADAPQVMQTIAVSLPAQLISFTAPATGYVGGSATLTATGGGSGNPVTFTVDSSSGAGVCGVSGDTVSYLAQGSCVIDANQAGSASYAAAQEVTQTIPVSPGLAITSGSVVAATAGEEFVFLFGADGGLEPYTWSLVSGSLPPGVSLSSAGLLSGTPTMGGTFDFTVAVTDAEDPVVTVTQAVTAQISLDVPGGSLATGFTGEPYSQAVSAADGVPPYTWQASPVNILNSLVSNVPPGLALSSSGVLSGTPTAAGSYAFWASAQDSQSPPATGTAIYVITISAGLAITSGPGPLPGLVGAAFSFPFTASGGTQPYIWSVASGSLPPGLILSSAGLLAGTPTMGGTFDFTVAVTDAENPAFTATEAVTVQIALAVPGGTLPEGFTGEPYSQALSAAGGMTPYTWSADPSTLPPGLALSSSGVLSGTPTAAGTYSLSVSVQDSQSPPATGSGVYSITISPGLAITSGPGPLDGLLGAAFSFPFTASGGTQPYTWSVASGSLPPGLILSSGGLLAGTPTMGGTFDFTVAVTDAENPAFTVTQAVTAQITGVAPAITSADSATFTAGTAGSVTVTTTGYPAPALTEAGALPSGVTFVDDGNGSATLAGTPAAGTEGTYPVTITAANSVGSATQAFLLTVTGGLAITSASALTATAGTAVSFTVTTSGTPAPTLTHTGSLPSGITFTAGSNGTATLAGTPAATAYGVYPITITAKNAEGATSQAFSLTVDAAPTFTSSAVVTETAGTAFGYAVATTAYPTAALTSGTLPGGMTFTDNGNGSGTLSGSSALAAGTYLITITAANTVSNVSQTITLTVKAAGKTEQVPAFTSPASATATVGTSLSFTVTTAGSPTSYTSNVTHSGALPPGVSFTNNGNGTATFSGTPTAAADGSYPITLTAKNSAGTTTQSFVLTVTGAPTITTAATATATVGSAFSIQVSATGSPTPAMTESGPLPQGLTWVDNGNGTATLAGTPTVNQGGVYPLTLTATNSLGSFDQTFTLTVDQAPAITSAATASATHGTPFSFTFTTTGYPQPTITHTGAVPGLTFASTSNGTATLSGTPTKAGTYTLTVTAKNSAGSATQTFTLVVN